MDSEHSASGSSEAASATPVTGAPSKLYVDASADLASSASALADSTTNNTQRAAPTIYRGNDTQVSMPRPSEPVKFLGDDVSLNFEQAPLSEVMHAIMGDILQLDYVVDQPVQGQVTLRTRTPIPRSQLLEVLESLLMANNALMVKGEDGRYLITASSHGKLSPRVSNPKNTDAGFSTIIVPLRYISASNMAEILKPVAEEQAFVLVDNSRNVLMLAGTREQLDGWLDIVTTFDVDQLKGMSVGMFPLENSKVDDVAKALSAMLESGEQADFVRVVPVERLNSLLVVTPRSNYLDTLGVWIERLDAEADSRFEKRLHVYPVQNTSAGRLAELLNGIYADQISATTSIETDAGGSQLGGTGQRAGVAPGMSPEMLGNDSTSSGVGETSMTEGFGNTPGGVESEYSSDQEDSISSVSVMAAAGGGTSPLKDVRVVADDENNALMIYSTGKQFDLIKAALDQLDVVATQVIIEASILEVTLTDQLRYGLEWTFNNALGDGYKGTGILTAIGRAPAANLPGFAYTVADSAGNINAVLNALSEERLINVISTPSVMVLDNNTAFIHVGDQQPIIDQQSISDVTNDTDNNRITQSISYKDTGVQLMVTPSVNAGGLVTMDIEQSVIDVGPVDLATGQRAFLERNIKSKVAVRSNQSVVLGGLIRENANEGDSGIPILHNLPWVGPLFGTVAKEDNRTELLVIITPRAIESENELYQVGEEMRSRIRHMELIEEEAPVNPDR